MKAVSDRRINVTSNVRATRVELPDGSITFTVVDAQGLPLAEVDEFLATYLVAIDASSNTIASYARHLGLFFRWLDIRQLSWEQINFRILTSFAIDLRDGTLPALRRTGEYRKTKPRSAATCKAVMAAVYAFLEYWRLEGRGPTDLQLYREDATSRRSTRHFLAHVEHQRANKQRRLKFKGTTPPPPRTIDFENDFEKLVNAASTWRDRALLSALYDGGLRISQALGLHHGDLDFARKSARVIRRTDNANLALSKQRNSFTVDLPKRFFDYYSRSLVEEQIALSIESDFVFVNLAPTHRGRAMGYRNAEQVIKTIGKRAGVDVGPHWLRHTHASALAAEGWSAPQIAARLGQSSPSSADVYIHLAREDIRAKYAASDLGRR